MRKNIYFALTEKRQVVDDVKEGMRRCVNNLKVR